MKSKIPGFLAVVLALSLSAFTSIHQKEATGYYWFPLDASSGDPLPVSSLNYQTYDPYFCTNWAPGGYCSGAYTSYTRSGNTYYASDVQMLVHFTFF